MTVNLKTPRQPRSPLASGAFSCSHPPKPMPSASIATSARSAICRQRAQNLKLRWPIETALRLAREEKVLKLDFDSATSPKARQDAAKTLLAHRAMLAELLQVPRRPQAPKWKPPTSSHPWAFRQAHGDPHLQPGPVELDVSVAGT